VVSLPVYVLKITAKIKYCYTMANVVLRICFRLHLPV